MEPNPAAPSKMNRIVTVVAVVSLLAMLGFGLYLCTPVRWRNESFDFQSGPTCYVFREPKLVVFLGDEENEVFDRLNGHGLGGIAASNFLGRSSSGETHNGVDVFSAEGYAGRTTIQFFDGKGSMVVSSQGTKLTLADGQKFTLDGKTPLWLRCKTDGTITVLDELPQGFVDFFESPPSDPGIMIPSPIESYPEAFRK